MQGKGFVRFFLILMILVTAVQFFYVIPTNRVENSADSYAAQLCASGEQACLKTQRANYLDSMSSESIFSIPYISDYTYQDLKARQLAYGLDLKGGMSVVMQVNLRDFLVNIADNPTDPGFVAALNAADEAQKETQSDYITLFVDAYRAGNQGNLANLFSRNLRNDINFETSDGEATRVLRTKADETVDLTFKLLKERIDKLGVVQPNVSLDEARDLILVELPGIDNPQRARNYLQAAAKLEFWNVYRVSDAGVVSGLEQANARLKATLGGSEATEAAISRIDTTYALDSLGNVDMNRIASVDTIYEGQEGFGNGPLFEVFSPNTTGNQGLSVIGSADKNKRNLISSYLDREDIKGLFPQNIKFLWSKDAVVDFNTGEKTNRYELYAIRKDRGNDTPPLEGDRVTDAFPTTDPSTGEVAISLSMDPQGAKKWGQMTTAAANDNNREIAIVLDDEVVSAPRVINPILNGSSSISGNYTVQSAKDLSNILQIGKLPAKTQIIQESLVGPSLGADNINRSMTAIAIGFGVVILFMIFYYGGGGIVSIICLLLNLVFIFGALASAGTVLTLPGIAGIVLTIGMAVDANVIIFERIREELRAGKTSSMAIRDGFKQSYSAIIDANVTTILVALVLMYFGLGPIKGFAVVLAIGVVSSLFTAVLVGYMFIDTWVNDRKKPMSFWAGWSKNALSDVNIDWMGKRKIGYVISGVLIAASLISFAVRGFDLGVDFKGGYSYTVQFDESVNVDAQTLRGALTDVFDGRQPVVKAVDVANTYSITTSYLVNDKEDDAADRVGRALFSGINSIAGGNLTYEKFKEADANTGTHITAFSQVGPTIADDIKSSSLYSGVFALLLIFLYLAIRFSNWRFSLGAVLALFHDVIITLGMFSIFHGLLPFSMEIDQALVAAILTVIGYSVNDTVIVFDRIREFINSYTGKAKEDIFNMAINSTLSRTLITSGTTLFVVLALFVFGGSTLKGFAFALLIGILVGTYSSIFVASASVNDLIKELRGKKVKTAEKKNNRTTFAKAD